MFGSFLKSASPLDSPHQDDQNVHMKCPIWASGEENTNFGPSLDIVYRNRHEPVFLASPHTRPAKIDLNRFHLSKEKLAYFDYDLAGNLLNAS